MLPIQLFVHCMLELLFLSPKTLGKGPSSNQMMQRAQTFDQKRSVGKNTHTHILHTTFHTLSFTHNFHTHTHHLSHTALSHTHTPSLFVTQHLSYTTLSYTIFFLSILHHILCLSFLPRPPYKICGSLLEEVDLWGYPVL